MSGSYTYEVVEILEDGSKRIKFKGEGISPYMSTVIVQGTPGDSDRGGCERSVIAYELCRMLACVFSAGRDSFRSDIGRLLGIKHSS